MLDLPAIRQRAEQMRKLQETASKGPWVQSSEYIDDAYGEQVVECDGTPEGSESDRKNAAFIVAARNSPLPADVLELVEEVERQRDLLDRALAIISNAIMHGMPVTEEVAAVRNGICLSPQEESETT